MTLYGTAMSAPGCCRRTLEQLPEAGFCVTCARAVVRCTRCGQAVRGDGSCQRCLRVRVAAESALEVGHANLADFRIKVSNVGESAMWLEAVRWRGVADDATQAVAVRAPLAPNEERTFHLTGISVGSAERIAAELTLVVGQGRGDLHELRSHDLMLGTVRRQSDAPAIGGDIHLGGGAQLVMGDYALGQTPSAPTPISFMPVAMTPVSEPAGVETPVADRTMRLIWTDPRSKDERIHHFGWRPTMRLGRVRATRAGGPGDEGNDLCWHAPLDGSDTRRRLAAEVSRSHARLLVRSGRVYLMDAGSTNGTTINGERLVPHTPRALRHGDVIAPWDAAKDAKYSTLGHWRVQFRANADGFTREIAIRYEKEI